jgi:hypothetical protein
MAPVPERTLTQVSSVPSTAAPIAAPIMSWATVPTTISDSAVDTRSQIDSRDAISARPSQSAAKAQIDVMSCLHVHVRKQVEGRQQKTRLAAGGGLEDPTA